ncbi:hypothetical protein [Microbulbifer sp. JTAC008]|uniref:hypothetical protein n=1 Tax=Microbulbifer sp. JTAC008 TaxID=3243374 RepID=UPI00403A7224
MTINAEHARHGSHRVHICRNCMQWLYDGSPVGPDGYYAELREAQEASQRRAEEAAQRAAQRDRVASGQDLDAIEWPALGSLR